MFLLVTHETKLDGVTLPEGLVLCVARDSPPEKLVVQLVSTLLVEPKPFSVADGFDFSFARCSNPGVIEFENWRALQTAARRLYQT